MSEDKTTLRRVVETTLDWLIAAQLAVFAVLAAVETVSVVWLAVSGGTDRGLGVMARVWLLSVTVLGVAYWIRRRQASRAPSPTGGTRR